MLCMYIICGNRNLYSKIFPLQINFEYEEIIQKYIVLNAGVL